MWHVFSLIFQLQAKPRQQKLKRLTPQPWWMCRRPQLPEAVYPQQQQQQQRMQEGQEQKVVLQKHGQGCSLLCWLFLVLLVCITFQAAGWDWTGPRAWHLGRRWVWHGDDPGLCHRIHTLGYVTALLLSYVVCTIQLSPQSHPHRDSYMQVKDGDAGEHFYLQLSRILCLVGANSGRCVLSCSSKCGQGVDMIQKAYQAKAPI